MGVYLYFYISDDWRIQISEKKEDVSSQKSWLLRRPFPKYQLWKLLMEAAFIGIKEDSIRAFFDKFKISLKDLPTVLDKIPPSESRMEGLCRIVESFGEDVDTLLYPNVEDPELLNIPDGGDVWQDQELC